MKINQLPDLVGVDGLELTATIVRVYPIAKGTSKYGEWTLQNIILKDETGSIKCLLKNRKECSTKLVGKTIKLASAMTDKGKKIGVRVVENTYKDKTSLELAVTGNAVISIVGEETKESPPEVEQEPMPAAPQVILNKELITEKLRKVESLAREIIAILELSSNGKK
jgi:hypothetical protein